MSQKLIQTQTQKQLQQQRLTQQQMLFVRLLEMPINELEAGVAAELDDNPALETSDNEAADITADNRNDESTDNLNDDFEHQTEREDREEALDMALENIGRDDEMPPTYTSGSHQDADYEEIVYGDTVSFYDKLKEQMSMEVLTPEQHDIMEYIIGSLDDDGLLRKQLDAIADELAIYHNIEVTEQQVEEVLNILQTFDPPGLGARSLQECLLLQVERKPESRLKNLMKQTLTEFYNEFTHKHWDKIQQQLRLNDLQMSTLKAEIVKLNPKPGASLGETEGRNTQQITPDFIVENNDDDSITFSLNTGNMPSLQVSPAFTDMMNAYKDNRKGMSRQAKEALLYAKEKVDRARGFIEAVRQRRHTLTITMKAIIDWQHKFFTDGDESDLQPMILKDIAGITGLDISTISRVANIKYVQTKWGVFPLKFFFTDSYTDSNGEETSLRKMRLALKEIVDNEDKTRPLSDDALADEMGKRGFPVARRTVAKYRLLLGIPVARLRKS